MANKHIDLFKEIMPAIDAGIKELYDAVDDDGRKEIEKDLWNLNRYISIVNGNYKKQALAVFRVNEYYNKNYNELQSKHKKLLWQLLCVAGETGGKEFHTWIKLERKKDAANKTVKFLSEIYPTMKWDEVETLARISTKQELKQLAEEFNIDIKF